MSVLFPPYTPVQGGAPNKRDRPFCMVVPILTIKPKRRRTRHCASHPLYSRTSASMRRLVCVESPMSGRSLQIETQATPATEQQGHGPDTAAIIACLLMHRKLIESCGMIYLIVDNRAPEEVEHVVGSQTSLGRTSARRH